ncbi:MAG: DUF1385 domain-containing protein [Clostridia bacterium]|nr:DUF1385 domain-containing protein [Clostridia bacterium]
MAEKNKNAVSCPAKGQVGGQALLEGVMMNSPKSSAMAVRHVSGRIIVKQKEFKHIKDKIKPLGWPMIRGVVSYIESMTFGYNCLMESAELSGGMETDTPEEEMSKLDKWITDHMGPKFMAALSFVSMVLGLAVSMLLFVYLPIKVVDILDGWLISGFGFHWNYEKELMEQFVLNSHHLHPLLEGILRIIILVAYMAIVSMQKDIRRTFKYHGAEHKSIACYEAGKELTVENVRECSRFHPRCGTSFIFIILIINILISSILVLAVPDINNAPTYIWFLIKLFVILPVVTGVSYEFLRYAGRHENIFVKIFSAPGLWMQRITTKEPDDDIIEVGIASLKGALNGAGQTQKELDELFRASHPEYAEGELPGEPKKAEESAAETAEAEEAAEDEAQ